MLDASNPIGEGGNEFDLKWENVKNKDGGPFMGPKRRFLADMEKCGQVAAAWTLAGRAGEKSASDL